MFSRILFILESNLRFYQGEKYLKKTITLPKPYWDKLYSMADDLEAGLSDALFVVVDLGFNALANAEVMDLLSDEEDEEEEDEEEEEEEE